MDITLLYVTFGLLSIAFVYILLDITEGKRQERRDQIVIKNLVKSLDDTTLIR